ncbi:hypothetical protein [Nannocystis punicea]|uniref:Uncharacterized protein n=1 Tax=Nannocystis punicea TaxID=2995304 RepID=A0ABY7H1U0_9BACT|nr:hypothetical protein [Nannocystis poenicansa]WAS93222.1 hypothetical protein O0S08_44240 [Nannocystis poenicansa]
MRSLLILVIAACGPQLPDEGATTGDTSTGATTTSSSTTTTSPTTTTGLSTGDSGSDSAASVDPPLKFDLPPLPPDVPPPTPPACDPPPDVSPDVHCEVVPHRPWDFMYACLEGADPDACPDAEAATVLDLLNDCSLCTGVGGDAMCGPDPRREDACCYWSFGLIHFCPP